MASGQAGISFQPIQAISKRITCKTRIRAVLFWGWKMGCFCGGGGKGAGVVAGLV